MMQGAEREGDPWLYVFWGHQWCVCSLRSEHFMLGTWLYLGQYWHVSNRKYSCPKPTLSGDVML